MTTCAAPDCSLLLRFQEFYAELHRLREQATGMASLPSAASTWPGSETLAHLLEQQAAQARATLAAKEFEVYREAQYVMVALADDLLSRPDEAGHLSRQSLEQRFFRANSAGEVFFQKLEDLLQGQEPEHIELAQLYFWAICLGFRGKYRIANDWAPLAAYRQRLFAMVFSGQPTLARNDAPLVQVAPAQTVAPEEIRCLPHPRIWMALPAGVLLLWVLFSFVFWTGFVRPLTQVLDGPPPARVVTGR